MFYGSSRSKGTGPVWPRGGTGRQARLKLFLNPRLAAACPEVAPLRQGGLTFREGSGPSPEQLQATVSCLGKLYEVRINGELVSELELNLYRHPATSSRGLLTYLATEDLPSGRNLIQVTHRHYAESEPEKEKVDLIPFWR